MERVPEGVARFHPRPEHEDNFYRVTRFKDQNDKVVPVSIAFKSSGAFCRQISCLRFQSRFGRNSLHVGPFANDQADNISQRVLTKLK